MLYLVATPIGNREDITIRALRTLRFVDIIFAEDTRKARVFLDLFRIKKPIDSYFEQNQKEKASKIVKLIQQGKKVALITEAGTPSISDPGFCAVRECIRHNLEVEIIPGVSAVTAAMAVSGLAPDRFFFAGFLPRKPGKRLKALQELLEINATIVLYESPQRMGQLLSELADSVPERKIVIAKEMTKLHQQIIRRLHVRDAHEELADGSFKGEYTVLIEGNTRKMARDSSDDEESSD